MMDRMMSVTLLSLVVGILAPLALASFAVYFYAMYKMAKKKKKPNFYAASICCASAAIVVAVMYWANV